MDTTRQGTPGEKAGNKEREPENESTKAEEKGKSVVSGGQEGEVEHEGGCHCGEVRWRVWAPLHPVGDCRIICTD